MLGFTPTLGQSRVATAAVVIVRGGGAGGDGVEDDNTFFFLFLLLLVFLLQVKNFLVESVMRGAKFCYLD